MHLPSPYSNFNFLNKKIKVKNTGGINNDNSTTVLIAVVIIILVILIVTIIIVVCCYRKRRSYTNVYINNARPLAYPQIPHRIIHIPYVQQQPIYGQNPYRNPINENQNNPNQINFHPNTTQQQYQNQYNNQNINQQQQGYNSLDINKQQQGYTSDRVGFDNSPPPAI